MTIFVCLSGRLPMFIHGGFESEEAAERWKDNATRWYGADHPLCPIRVEPLKMNPPLFPADQWEALKDTEEGSPAQDRAIHALFATLVDDPKPDVAPPGLRGGRKR